MESDDNDTAKETLVYLNFNGKIPLDMLDNQVFLKITKLDTKNPVVQVNDMIFKSNYTQSIGTNLFFMKDTDPDKAMEFPYKNGQLQTLKFFQSQSKVLNCQQLKLPSIIQPPVTSNDNVTYNFNWDYKELLKRFENGTLQLQDMFDKKSKPEMEVQQTTPPESEPIHSMVIEDVAAPTNDSQSITQPTNDNQITLQEVLVEIPSELLTDYHNLLNLAKTPVRRQEQIEEVSCDLRFKNQYNFKSIECKILEPPLFSYPDRCTPNSPFPHVDVQRCISLKLMSPTTTILPESILKLENLPILDLEARYGVIEGLIETLRREVGRKDNTRDMFGRTPKETLEVLEKLLEGLRRRIVEIKESL